MVGNRRQDRGVMDANCERAFMADRIGFVLAGANESPGRHAALHNSTLAT